MSVTNKRKNRVELFPKVNYKRLQRNFNNKEMNSSAKTYKEGETAMSQEIFPPLDCQIKLINRFDLFTYHIKNSDNCMWRIKH